VLISLVLGTSGVPGQPNLLERLVVPLHSKSTCYFVQLHNAVASCWENIDLE
jgi:hypothetical protein